MALEWVGGARRFADLSDDLLGRLASRARLAQQPVVRAARAAVARFLDVWPGAKDSLDVPRDVARGDRAQRRAGAVVAKGGPQLAAAQISPKLSAMRGPAPSSSCLKKTKTSRHSGRRSASAHLARSPSA